MIQTPKAAIPAEINNESALSIWVPFQGLVRQERGRQLKWPNLKWDATTSLGGAGSMLSLVPELLVNIAHTEKVNEGELGHSRILTDGTN
jgi:hypothetical protein